MAGTETARAEAADAFMGLYETVKTLRAPGGCPWDREQTPATLRGNLIEESYECIEAINEGDSGHIQEELGDLFLLVVMLSYMHEQEGLFSVAGTLSGITEKLIRRHPHVFAGLRVKDSAEVLENWTKIKVETEGRKPKDSILDEVSRALPAMERAYQLQKKAAKIGFDWPDLTGIWRKIAEESEEVKDALAAADSGAQGSEAGAQEDKAGAQGDKVSALEGEVGALEGEVGDLLFSVINLCRFLHINPSAAIQRTNTKFENRFKYAEKKARALAVPDAEGKYPLEILDTFWNEAKSIA